MSLKTAQKVIVPQKKNYVPHFLKQRDINSYCVPSRASDYLFWIVLCLFHEKHAKISKNFITIIYQTWHYLTLNKEDKRKKQAILHHFKKIIINKHSLLYRWQTYKKYGKEFRDINILISQGYLNSSDVYSFLHSITALRFLVWTERKCFDADVSESRL